MDKESPEAKFARVMRAVREERELTQAQLAALLNVSDVPMDAGTLAKIERGERRVKLDEAVMIADMLGVSIGWMLDSDEAQMVGVPVDDRIVRLAADLDEMRAAVGVLAEAMGRGNMPDDVVEAARNVRDATLRAKNGIDN